jgi:hypothetical protein
LDIVEFPTQCVAVLVLRNQLRVYYGLDFFPLAS